jgi:hypothetical protein
MKKAEDYFPSNAGLLLGQCALTELHSFKGFDTANSRISKQGNKGNGERRQGA